MFKYLLPLILLSACKSTPLSQASEAEKYIEEVLQILEARSVRRKHIDWPQFRNKVLAHAKHAKTVEDTYPSITYAVRELGDGHSYFRSVMDTDSGGEQEAPVLTDEEVPQDIAYIRVPYCIGDQAATDLYIAQMLQKIKAQDHASIKGWIVDLRGNFGGNMWPMLVGIGPILGEGIVGYNVDPDLKKQVWKYTQGKALLDDTLTADAAEYYRLKGPDPIVAVLTDQVTASSGEALAVAFRGRPLTRSFGAATFGVSTSNLSHTLSDGSSLNLSTSVFADRASRQYGASIEPDTELDPGKAPEEAIRWIRDAYRQQRR